MLYLAKEVGVGKNLNMPTKIECGLVTCIYNDKSRKKYGICRRNDITLKFRLAGDFGKGNIVFIECLMMELLNADSRSS